MSSIGVDWEARVDWDLLRTSRIERAKNAIQEAELDGLLVQRMDNVRYLTSMRGFVSMMYYPRYGAFLSAGGDVTLLTEAGDFATVGPNMPWIEDVRIWAYDVAENARTVSNVLEDKGIVAGRIGFDDVTSPAVLFALKEQFPDIQFVDATGPIAAAKVIKHPEEVKVLRAAAEIAEIGMAAARDSIAEGVRENEVAGEMLRAMSAAGADAMLSHPQVSTDALRRMGTDKRIRFGELVLIDINVGYNGYVGDFARTFAVGGANDAQRRMYAVQRECLSSAIEAVTPGADTQVVQDAVADTVKAAGAEEHWHGYITGHGVGTGLGPWEQPLIGTTMGAITELKEGMVIAFEPGIFDPAIGPVRNEEMVLCTADGHEVLTRFGFDEKLM